jgi:hypothetical protein
VTADPARARTRPGAPDGAWDPGSFRDRSSRVYEAGGEILRALSPSAREEWMAVSAAAFFQRALAEGRVVATEPSNAALPQVDGERWVAALRHERVPFVSYPYEWTFGMLKDAALLQLDLLDAALSDGFILKDASAYNVQWRGAVPVFIDVGSFERHAPGTPWTAYRQFCQLFLYPLLLQAYRGAPFQPWLRGCLDGITPEDIAALLTWRDLLRPGVLANVWLMAKLSRRYGGSAGNLGQTLGAAGFDRGMIRANVRRLARVVRRLRWDPPRSTWSDYATHNSYADGDRAAKVTFVDTAAGARPRRLVWDLGSNTGDYSRLAATHARYVLAVDADHLALERLYRALRAEGNRSILPLFANLADPSPGIGWRGLERGPMAARGRPDLVLALALVHHLVLAANVPLEEVVSWFADLGAELVVEFVRPEDPMAKRLLAGRPPFPDYREDHFESCLAERFTSVARQVLPSGTRVLHHVVPR